MSAGAYLAGALELVLVVGSLGLAAVKLRARLLAGWGGAPARLAEAVLGVALLIWAAELLGLFGLLKEAPLVLVAVAVGAASLRLRSARPEGPPPAAPLVGALAMLVTVGVVALLFAHWGFVTKGHLNNGITNFDSLWYHLPYAADIAQSGSVTSLHHTDTVFLNWFYPQNSELVHAVGMILTDRDTLSLFINLGWLGLALLSAWCIGRPWGRGPHAVAAVALVLEAQTLVFREPGAAKNDVVAAALVLAAAALLVSGYVAGKRGTSNEERGTDEPRPPIDPAALGIAGLAAGLAVGTKFTVLATVAAMTVAVIVLAARGGRRSAALAWFAPLLAGGAFWYVRNLFTAGNPLPQVQHLGPLSLPGPERLQTARPDFPIVHYATDTRVWSDYFGPGLREAFGLLWPLVLAAGVAGAVLVIARRDERLLPALGAVALFGVLAYLVTPLSAAGAEGSPVAFAINIRFALPPLILGLALLAMGRGLESHRAGWALLVAVLAVLVVTDESTDVLRAPERAFGALVAFVAIIVPAGLLWLRSRGSLSWRGLAAGFAILVAGVVAIGYPVQRDYLDSRWRNFDPDQHLDSAYRWAAEVRESRIGLAGTTTGFLGYGFYGPDLSNHVQYLGEEGPHGAFNAIRTCARFREAVNDAELDYLVTGPFLNFIHPSEPLFSPEAGWIATDPALRTVSRDGTGVERVTVWKVDGRLDPAGCARVKVPRTSLPNT
ncbi:MAG: hypothetical protein AABM29_00840 [Actinomycetota bacterium]